MAHNKELGDIGRTGHPERDAEIAEGMANARLIAAAPELLELVEEYRMTLAVVNGTPSLEWRRTQLARIDAMLAKAKGTP